MKRTNIVLDENLVEEAIRTTGLKTARAVVNHALHELVRREKQLGILRLKGKLKWEGDLNLMRESRFQ